MKIKGFTLAEVLITLGIIGVVAALTIPSIIGKYEEKVTVTRLKKTYAVLDNAMRLAVNENGSSSTWGLSASGSGSGPEDFIKILAPYLSIAKNCGAGKGCFASGKYSSMDGNDAYFSDTSTTFGKFVLNDGVAVAVWIQYGTNSNGVIVVDVNGKKGPNMNGRDVFWLVLKDDRIHPAGLPVDNHMPFAAYCIGGSGYSTGRGCSGWALVNENLEYLKCKDLNWNTKTKCK